MAGLTTIIHCTSQMHHKTRKKKQFYIELTNIWYILTHKRAAVTPLNKYIKLIEFILNHINITIYQIRGKWRSAQVPVASLLKEKSKESSQPAFRPQGSSFDLIWFDLIWFAPRALSPQMSAATRGAKLNLLEVRTAVILLSGRWLLFVFQSVNCGADRSDENRSWEKDI